MNHYLVVFDRSSGEVLRSQRFTDPGKALEARFAEERKHRGEASIEVVVLGADSWDALRRRSERARQGFYGKGRLHGGLILQVSAEVRAARRSCGRAAHGWPPSATPGRRRRSAAFVSLARASA